MRLLGEKDYGGYLFRMMHRGEIAYLRVGLCGLQAEIEFPSDWHEHRRAWVRLGFILFKLAFSFPWSKVVPDDSQCSGPRYGFYIFNGSLVICTGKTTSTSNENLIFYDMPWMWRHRKHKVLSEPSVHTYTYTLKSGVVQERTASIQVEERTFTRPWIPHKRVSRYIDVKFSDEVGERSGSWKGGVLGCSYDMLPNERPADTLRRMERDRRF